MKFRSHLPEDCPPNDADIPSGEVMSPSSADYDQGTKATYYRGLPSVQIYLLIEQARPYVQLYTRHERVGICESLSALRM